MWSPTSPTFSKKSNRNSTISLPPPPPSTHSSSRMLLSPVKMRRRLSGLFAGNKTKREDKAVGTEILPEVFHGEERDEEDVDGAGPYVLLVRPDTDPEREAMAPLTLRLDVPRDMEKAVQSQGTHMDSDRTLSPTPYQPSTAHSITSFPSLATTPALLSPASCDDSDASSLRIPVAAPLDAVAQMQTLCRLRASYAASHERNLAMLEEKMTWMQMRKKLEAEVSRLRREREQWAMERDEVEGVREMVEGMCKEMDEEAERAERELEEMRMKVVEEEKELELELELEEAEAKIEME